MARPRRRPPSRPLQPQKNRLRKRRKRNRLSQQPLPLQCSARKSTEEEEARSSPLVRKIAREHGVSLSQVSGTGLGGRITKQDIMSFIEGRISRAGLSAREAAPPTPSRAAAAAAPLPIPAISFP